MFQNLLCCSRPLAVVAGFQLTDLNTLEHGIKPFSSESFRLKTEMEIVPSGSK